MSCAELYAAYWTYLPVLLLSVKGVAAKMVVASKIHFHHVIVCLWSKFAHKCSMETAIFTRPRKWIAVSALPPSAINCGKWWWRQASFVIVILFAMIYICRPMYLSSGNAKIAMFHAGLSGSRNTQLQFWKRGRDCGKWQSSQASFVIDKLSAVIHMWQPTYSPTRLGSTSAALACAWLWSALRNNVFYCE